MMETSAASPPTVDPKWLSARRASERAAQDGGYGGDGSRPVAPSTSTQFSRTCAVKWDLSERRRPATGCVPGQSAPLPRTKRQRLKFQKGGEGGGRCVTWHDTATVPPRDSLKSVPIGLQRQSPECVSCPGWTEDVQKSGGFWSLCSLQMHQFMPRKLQMWSWRNQVFRSKCAFWKPLYRRENESLRQIPRLKIKNMIGESIMSSNSQWKF